MLWIRKKCTRATLGYNDKICYTALTFFRRFFFTNSVIEFNPMCMSVVCIFVAAKVEEKDVKLEEFFRDHCSEEAADSKYFPGLNIELIKQYEVELCKALNFEFLVHNPLHSIKYLEQQCLKHHPNLKEPIEATFRRAGEMAL